MALQPPRGTGGALACVAQGLIVDFVSPNPSQAAQGVRGELGESDRLSSPPPHIGHTLGQLTSIFKKKGLYPAVLRYPYGIWD